ncbi:unnamed protein product [Rotaria sordida]|uniref:Uncharacterized protein n=1 Tax=Rotaria sordida TaxID=392033 RepID=A0A815P6Q2_9BILA|nr:unnamed protein product [Rotaria sordida]CAF1444961.1 unnamed protein product [Rotaria sordida]
MRSCFSYTDDTKSPFCSSITHIDPSQLLSFLKTKLKYYREQDVLDVIQKYQASVLIPSIVYLLEHFSQYTKTFDLLLKSMH